MWFVTQVSLQDQGTHHPSGHLEYWPLTAYSRFSPGIALGRRKPPHPWLHPCPWLMWGCTGPALYLKWNNNKWLCQFQNFPWDQLRSLLQVHQSATLPSLWPPSLLKEVSFIAENTPHKPYVPKSPRLRICLPVNLTYGSIFPQCSQVPIYSSLVLITYTQTSAKLLKNMSEISSPLITFMTITLVWATIISPLAHLQFGPPNWLPCFFSWPSPQLRDDSKPVKT